MARILLLNGPNLNLLGSREPGIYGSATLPSIEKKLEEAARARSHELIAFQSNAEHELIDRVQGAKSDGVAFIIINPGAPDEEFVKVHHLDVEYYVQTLDNREILIQGEELVEAILKDFSSGDVEHVKFKD